MDVPSTIGQITVVSGNVTSFPYFEGATGGAITVISRPDSVPVEEAQSANLPLHSVNFAGRWCIVPAETTVDADEPINIITNSKIFVLIIFIFLLLINLSYLVMDLKVVYLCNFKTAKIISALRSQEQHLNSHGLSQDCCSPCIYVGLACARHKKTPKMPVILGETEDRNIPLIQNSQA